MSRVRKVERWLADLLLIFTFLVVVLTSSYAVISTERDSQRTHALVNRTVCEALGNLKNGPVVMDTLAVQRLETFLQRLEAKSEGTLSSSTMSVLFTVFSLALVSAGSYLLSQNRRTVREMESQVELMESRVRLTSRYLQGTQWSFEIPGALEAAHHSTDLFSAVLSAGTLRTAMNTAALFQDSLLRAKANRAMLPSSVFASLVDRARLARKNLDRVPEVSEQYGPEDLKTLKNIWDHCLSLLDSSGFAERYNECTEALGKAVPV